jgi:methylenetetrahydrofolate reductase (NADPH)
VDKCREAGINVPIIPGLKILTGKKQLTGLPKIFHIDSPEVLYEEVLKAKNDADVKQIGVEWCIQQCKELLAANVPVLHFYTMGSSENTRRVASAIF